MTAIIIKLFIIDYMGVHMGINTMVQLRKRTVSRLQKLKRYRRQSYDEVINLLLDNPDDLGKDDIGEIRQGLDDTRSGRVYSEEEVAKKLKIRA